MFIILTQEREISSILAYNKLLYHPNVCQYAVLLIIKSIQPSGVSRSTTVNRGLSIPTLAKILYTLHLKSETKLRSETKGNQTNI